MQETLIKLPKSTLDGFDGQLTESNFQVRIVNDVYNTPHKVIKYLDFIKTAESTKDSDYVNFAVSWDKLEDQIDAFSMNVNLLEILLENKVCHRQFAIVGKDITLGINRVELIK